MIIRAHAYARAGLIGNPSDGFYGKTIAISLRNFRAEVVLYESPELEILPQQRDLSRFSGIDQLVQDVQMHGYYGGIRLLKATIKVFADYCRQHGIALPARNFTLRYQSDIPRLVGLAGSSAIITAAMRALMQFYQVQIPKELLPSLILSVETAELGIGAGLQDRVAQVYEGLTYMDFRRDLLETTGHGHYESLDPALLPPLYVAYAAAQAEPTERFHNTIRVLYDRGDSKVIETMDQIASLAAEARQCLLARRPDRLGPLLNRNFDLRASIFPLKPAHRAMVEAARRVGATAKFAGSGGAIIGTYDSPQMLAQLRERLEAIGCRLVQPKIV
ncbi:MAG: mevalonate kinase [Phycisphaerae bacterium]